MLCFYKILSFSFILMFLIKDVIKKNTKEVQHRNFLLEWNKANSQTTSEQQPSFTILYKQCFLREETKTTAPIHLSFHCICHTPGCLFSLSCPEESNDSSVYCVCSVCVQCVCVFLPHNIPGRTVRGSTVVGLHSFCF